MNTTTRAYLQLHFAVFAFGFTAILGDLISLSALNLVWWRVLMTSISLLFFVDVRSLFQTLSPKRLLQFVGIGILIALHWVCFYGAIKLANASIALVCMATASFFAAFLEPLFTKTPIKKYQVALGLFMIPGMLLVVNGIEVGMLLGLWVGLAASLLATIFSVFNKMLIEETDSYSMTFLELGSAWLFLSILLPFFLDNWQSLQPSTSDWLYLLVLSLVCTTLAFVLSLKALKHLSAFAS
ncbi:MAG: DMT family transporter, partial [Bacteroidota bacterium]